MIFCYEFAGEAEKITLGDLERAAVPLKSSCLIPSRPPSSATPSRGRPPPGAPLMPGLRLMFALVVVLECAIWCLLLVGIFILGCWTADRIAALVRRVRGL